MGCEELQRRLAAGLEFSRAEEDHLQGCEPCQELALGGGSLATTLERGREQTTAPAVSTGFARLKTMVAQERGVLARLSELPTHVRLILLFLLVTLVAGINGFATPRPDLSVHPLPRMLFALGVFWAATMVACRAAVRPLQQPSLSGRQLLFLVVAIGLGVPVLLASLPVAHLDHSMSFQLEGLMFRQKALACFMNGSAQAVPLLVLCLLLDRGGRALSNRNTLFAGVAAGALLGNLALQLRCPITEHGHLLLGHASIGAALPLLALVAYPVLRRLFAPS